MVAIARSLIAEALLVALAPVALTLVRYFTWGAGPLRVLCCLLLFIALALLTARRGYLSSVWEGGRRHWMLAAISCVLFALHVPGFVRDIRAGDECLTDMGRPSICAGEWLRHGLNPWAECAPRPTAAQRRAFQKADTYGYCVLYDRCLDYKAGGSYANWKHHGPGFDFMDGYKYGPLMALIYAPVVHTLRESGLYLVNFGFWLLQALAIWGVARVAYPEQRAAPARAVCAWLVPLILPMKWLPNRHIDTFWSGFDLQSPETDTFLLEVTRRCSNDIIPVVLMLGALYFAGRKHAAVSGILLGFSLATKPLPGLLLAAILPGLRGLASWRLALVAAATTALCYLPFFAWAPREMIANLVLFSLLRPTNGSTVRPYLPAGGDSVVGILQVLFSIGLIIDFYRRPRSARDLPAVLRTTALVTIWFVALNKVVHGNYLLWIQPLCALTLAGIPFRAWSSPAPRETIPPVSR